MEATNMLKQAGAGQTEPQCIESTYIQSVQIPVSTKAPC